MKIVLIPKRGQVFVRSIRNYSCTNAINLYMYMATNKKTCPQNVTLYYINKQR